MEEQKKAGWKRYLRFFIAGMIIGGVTYALMSQALLYSCIVGNSMAPALKDGDRTIGLRAAFMGEVHRGDVISFRPSVDRDSLYVKRVIGLPGETVTISGGKICVDGQELKEPYVAKWKNADKDYEFHVPEECYLVLGDNRDESYDSRCWADPYVAHEDIIARSNYAYRTGDGIWSLK